MADKNFNIIRHRGDAKKAETLKGQAIQRQESLYVPEWGAFVNCAPYSEHFLFADSASGQSAYSCTCGSAAVVVPPDKRGMFVCLFHATYGFHQTSVINVKDFHKSAGETVEVSQKGKRWA